MKINENQWKSIKTPARRARAYFMDSHWFSLILFDFHGFSLIFMDSHGFSCFLYTTDLEPMVFRTHNCFMDHISKKSNRNIKNHTNRDFDFLTGSERFFDDFKKIIFSIEFFRFFKNLQKSIKSYVSDTNGRRKRDFH